MINKKYLILTAEGGNFSEMSDMLLNQVSKDDTPLRLAFFGAPEDNEEYLSQLGVLRQKVKARFGNENPVLTYIAQKPLVGMLKLEVTALDQQNGLTVDYHDDYLLVRSHSWKELITGGIISDDIEKPAYSQSQDIFKRLETILDKEGFVIEDIFRQWNYIENITESDETGKQHYQEFNDARSEFYAKGDWSGGYPAATGIGTQLGGIMVELNAIKGSDIINIPVDNSLQVAAHAYSQQVLIGEKNRHKTTPKFERARIVGSGNGIYTAFISGTAAIRGEESLTDSDIRHQIQVTMENIDFLISAGNTKIEGTRRYKLLRIYIKYPEHIEITREYMNINYPHVPKFSLYADICRDELLIEIEGVAEITQ